MASNGALPRACVGLARVAEQALERAVTDAQALELIEGCASIVMRAAVDALGLAENAAIVLGRQLARVIGALPGQRERQRLDRKSTRLNSSHSQISYAVFCLKN